MKIERFLYVYSGLHLLLITPVLPLWVLVSSGILYVAGFVSLILDYRWKSWLVQVLAGLGLGATFVWVRPVLGLENSAALCAWVLALQIHNLNQARARRTQMYVCLFALSIFLIDRNNTLSILVLFADLIFFFSLFFVSNAQASAMTAISLKRSMRMVVLTMPIWILLFVFFPRFTLNIWGVRPGEAHQTGFSEELSPGQVSRVVTRDEVVLRFRLPDVGYLAAWGQQFYIRGGVLNESQGLGWKAGQSFLRPWSLRQDIKRGEGTDLKTEVWIEPRFGRNLFGVEQAKDIELFEGFESSMLFQTRGQSYRLQNPLRRMARYVVYSDTQSELSPIDSPEEIAAALALPDSVRRDIALIKDFPDLSKMTTIEALDAIENFYRRRLFRYTLSPPSVPSLSSFMNESRLGFCEHYASATANMLRAYGHPARVAIGFLGGSLNTVSQEFTVFDRDAHAWVEVYDKTRGGWRRFDPTAVIQPLRLEMGSIIYRMTESELRLAEVGHYVPGVFKSFKESLELYWDAWGQSLQRQILFYDGSWIRNWLTSLGLGEYSLWISIVAMGLIFVIVLPLLRLWMNPPERLTETQKLLRSLRRHFKLPDSRVESERQSFMRLEELLVRDEKYLLEMRAWFTGFESLCYGAMEPEKRAECLKELKREWARLKRQTPRQQGPYPEV